MPEYGEIMKRLGDIEIQSAKIEQIVTSSHKAFRDSEAKTNEMLMKHNLTIYGNGKPGLTTEVSYMKSLKKSFDDHSRNDMWGFGIMITILITILGWTVFHT